MSNISDLIDKVDEAKKIDGKGSPKSKATFASFIIGGVVGTMIGSASKWNIFYSAIGGAAMGGIVGALFVPGSKKTEE